MAGNTTLIGANSDDDACLKRQMGGIIWGKTHTSPQAKKGSDAKNDRTDH